MHKSKPHATIAITFKLASDGESPATCDDISSQMLPGCFPKAHHSISLGFDWILRPRADWCSIKNVGVISLDVRFVL